jgi:excinuclease ABC subunit C
MHIKTPEMKDNGSKKYLFSIAGESVYPHLKLTNEWFPRILATRRIENDGAEYFGAFLNRTNVRMLIDFVNRTFRLRSCYIPVDGSFSVPCVQFYRKRCLAPCVVGLCDGDAYYENVQLARLFLQNKRDELSERLTDKINRSAEAEDFESAAFWRDILQAAESFWQNPRYQVWLDDTVDTYMLGETGASIEVYLITTRGPRVLGRKVFMFERPEGDEIDPARAIGDVILQFYRFHLPREIRAYRDFPERSSIASALSKQFGRPLEITVVKEDMRPIMADRAFKQTKLEFDIEMARGKKSHAKIGAELKESFGLRSEPHRIEAFDVAHISGTQTVAAKVVWENGKFLKEEDGFWFSDQQSEPATIEKFVKMQLTGRKNTTDLILIDGGKAQLNAAMRGTLRAGRSPFVIAAVKPHLQHSQISHFLTEDGRVIPFASDNEAFSLLQVLRDEAHDLANFVHRARREMAYYYEPASILPSLTERQRQQLLNRAGSIKRLIEMREADLATFLDEDTVSIAAADLEAARAGITQYIEPLIVPIRFDASNGDADDLRPIETV